MGFIELVVISLFGIFAYMKVNEKGNIANWSWWRVTSPLWIYAIVAFITYSILAALIIAAVVFV